jgi:hypothetical protein
VIDKEEMEKVKVSSDYRFVEDILNKLKEENIDLRRNASRILIKYADLIYKFVYRTF